MNYKSKRNLIIGLIAAVIVIAAIVGTVAYIKGNTSSQAAMEENNIENSQISNNIDGEALFMDAYNISKMFRFQMKNSRLIIILDTIKLDEHYLIPLTKLLNQVTFRPSNID